MQAWARRQARAFDKTECERIAAQLRSKTYDKNCGMLAPARYFRDRSLSTSRPGKRSGKRFFVRVPKAVVRRSSTTVPCDQASATTKATALTKVRQRILASG